MWLEKVSNEIITNFKKNILLTDNLLGIGKSCRKKVRRYAKLLHLPHWYRGAPLTCCMCACYPSWSQTRVRSDWFASWITWYGNWSPVGGDPGCLVPLSVAVASSLSCCNPCGFRTNGLASRPYTENRRVRGFFF